MFHPVLIYKTGPNSAREMRLCVTVHGQPILPRVGDLLVVDKKTLIVTEIVWFLDDPDDKPIHVYAKIQ
jgi:hypothetical protein